MKNTNKIFSVILLIFSVTAFASTPTIYFNGDILTMEGETPNYVEAIIVKDDKITFTGKMTEALTQAGLNPALHDLKGHSLLPGFIDTWGHFTLIAQDSLGVNVAYFSKNPPQNKKQLIDKLKKEGKPFNGWIIGTGYRRMSR